MRKFICRKLKNIEKTDLKEPPADEYCVIYGQIERQKGKKNMDIFTDYDKARWMRQTRKGALIYV